MRRRHQSEEGASRELLLPGDSREPGLQEAALRVALCSRLQVRYTRVTLRFFSSDFEKTPTQESDVRKIIAEVQATRWRLPECIRVRVLAATHRLGQMRRLRMLEEKKAWKREVDFDKIEITAEMDDYRLHTSFDFQPFYTKLYNRRRLYTPEE